MSELEGEVSEKIESSAWEDLWGCRTCGYKEAIVGGQRPQRIKNEWMCCDNPDPTRVGRIEVVRAGPVSVLVKDLLLAADQLQVDAKQAAEFLEEEFGADPHPESAVPNARKLREAVQEVREKMTAMEEALDEVGR